MKFRAFATMEEVVRIISENGVTQIDVRCGSEIHVIIFKNGQIVPQNHSLECVEQEESLSKLGGGEPEISCVRIKAQLACWCAQGLLVL